MSEQQGRHFAISAWAIRNPVPVAVLFLGLIMAGLISYMGLPIKQYPNIELPVIAVTVTQNGAEIVACAFVIELEFLKGRPRLAPHEVFSLIQY